MFLDADHSEAGVAAELSEWLPKLRPGGVLAVHDSINIRGVCRAINQPHRNLPCPHGRHQQGKWLDAIQTLEKAR